MSIKVDTVVYETGKDPPAYRVSQCESQYILTEISYNDKYIAILTSASSTVLNSISYGYEQVL